MFEPIHIKGNVLELVLTSAIASIDYLTSHPLSVVNFSDHVVISFDLHCNVPVVSVSKPGKLILRAFPFSC